MGKVFSPPEILHFVAFTWSIALQRCGRPANWYCVFRSFAASTGNAPWVREGPCWRHALGTEHLRVCFLLGRLSRHQNHVVCIPENLVLRANAPQHPASHPIGHFVRISVLLDLAQSNTPLMS